jgi:hypothetical protein
VRLFTVDKILRIVRLVLALAADISADDAIKADINAIIMAIEDLLQGIRILRLPDIGGPRNRY